MRLQKSNKANVNYLAKVINITSFTEHPNPEVTKMKVAHVDGYNICVGINEPEGYYVYFPTMSQINGELLRYLNLYSDKELNNNPDDKPGFFSKNGRVKAIRLKGLPSGGFLLPFSHFNNWLVDSVNKTVKPTDGLEFDEVADGDKSFWVCRKYIVPTQVHPYDRVAKKNRRDKHLKLFDRIRDDQFHFHYDTILLRKCPQVIQPDDLIHISSKWHGTSHISAYVLCHHPLNWRQKIAKWLTGASFDEYGYIYSSRSVIKNQYYNKKVTPGFYNCDVWGIAHKVLQPHLIKGMTIYAEIVGFLPTGGYIQKNYDYGCEPPTENEYKEGKNFKIYVYRITTVNEDGIIHEWSTQEVQTWCKNQGLRPVIQLYYGKAKDLYPELNINEHWTENFMDKLANDKRFFMEMDSPDCSNKVPHEGIVIKRENMISEAFKLKCFKFLGKEQEALDRGETNIEDNEESLAS